MTEVETDSLPLGTTAPGWQLRIAKLLTETFAPVVLIFGLLVIVSIHATGSWLRGTGIGLLAALFAGGLPYAVLLVGVHSGRLGDRHLSRREERPLMMGLGLVSVTCGLLVMRWMDAPRAVYALVAAMVAGVAVALAISLFWKISIHTACTAGATVVLAMLVGAGWLGLAAVLAAVGWARVRLRDHSMPQVVFGGIIGAVVAGGTILLVL
jgi:hypothetical protein